MKKAHAFAIFMLIFACQKQSVVPAIYKVDKDLEVYVKSFIDEAKKRGIEIKAENLIMEFGVASSEICGQFTQAASNGQRTIVIRNESSCWKNAPNENREALVFHELGHGLLGRLHRDDLLLNGAVASIMNSQSSGAYEPCGYDISGDNNGSNCNKTSRRSYYIDELFDAKTAIPPWGK
jgi:hypothetical protein